MEDQFGGRTDDDLFYDDFEPVESAPVVVIGETRQPRAPQSTPADDPSPSLSPSPAAPAAAPASAPVASSSSPASEAPAPAPAPAARRPAEPATPGSVPPSRSLASSRFADKPTTTTSSSPSSSQKDVSATASTAAAAGAAAAGPPPPSAPSRGDHPKPTAATATTRAPLSQNTAASAEARLKSGANPRQKLTDDELAAKMAQMKLLAAEKTRKFQMAEQDEKQHAEAYARGMEEARRRRADDALRRRRADDDRRRLDDERARNRERKLKAMSLKQGGWDEGKEAMARNDDGDSGGAFRSANGGVRGVKARAGLAGSRFARDTDEPDVDRFLDDRHRSRARGRGGGGRARGGAHRPNQDGRATPPPPNKTHDATPALDVDQFPALPPGGGGEGRGGDGNPPIVPPLPTPPAVGKWDDEMEALDAVKEGHS